MKGAATPASKHKPCATEGCTSKAKPGGTPCCKAHGGGKRCTFVDDNGKCGKSAEGKISLCKAHGGGKRCQYPGCTKSAAGKVLLCKAHGGGKRCQHPEGCTKSAQDCTRFCIRHGGGSRCKHEGCDKSARGGSGLFTGLCRGHGGGKRCVFEGCKKPARGSESFCTIHEGGNKRCQEDGSEMAGGGVSSSFCAAHTGDDPLCQHANCDKQPVLGKHFCTAHRKRSKSLCQHSPSFCSKKRIGTTQFCVGHGGGTRCQHVGGCKNGKQGPTTFCVAHGGGKRCTENGCTKTVVAKTSFCCLHGGPDRPPSVLKYFGKKTGHQVDLEDQEHGKVQQCHWFDLVGHCDKDALSNSRFCSKHAHASPNMLAVGGLSGSPPPPSSPGPPTGQGSRRSLKSRLPKRAKLTNHNKENLNPLWPPLHNSLLMGDDNYFDESNGDSKWDDSDNINSNSNTSDSDSDSDSDYMGHCRTPSWAISGASTSGAAFGASGASEPQLPLRPLEGFSQHDSRLLVKDDVCYGKGDCWTPSCGPWASSGETGDSTSVACGGNGATGASDGASGTSAPQWPLQRLDEGLSPTMPISPMLLPAVLPQMAASPKTPLAASNSPMTETAVALRMLTGAPPSAGCRYGAFSQTAYPRSRLFEELSPNGDYSPPNRALFFSP